MPKNLPAALMISASLLGCATQPLPVIVEPPTTPAIPAALSTSDATPRSIDYSQRASAWESKLLNWQQKLEGWSTRVREAWQKAPR